ncbi:hypothetical protein BLOT_014197 [Blomia tropicalis]|nr:hypothetical protein BLOT_014197 [Blomia tropicalis]
MLLLLAFSSTLHYDAASYSFQTTPSSISSTTTTTIMVIDRHHYHYNDYYLVDCSFFFKHWIELDKANQTERNETIRNETKGKLFPQNIYSPTILDAYIKIKI